MSLSCPHENAHDPAHLALCDQWVCECGNYAEAEGFHPCNDAGEDMEPNIGSGWVDTYRCDRCGIVWRQNGTKVSEDALKGVY